ncbi:hypothetical protein Aduo_006369 [Ancylostoma duodenale]
MVRIGFDVAVKDQKNRKEHINRRVLVSRVRITGLANPKKWKIDELLRVSLYNNELPRKEAKCFLMAYWSGNPP